MSWFVIFCIFLVWPVDCYSQLERCTGCLVTVRILCCMCAGYPAVPLGVSNGGAGSPLGPRTGSPPESQQSNSQASSQQQQQQQQQSSNGQSPMAALMSVADNLPPGSPRSAGGSPPGSGGPRSASRGSQHSPNSSGKWSRNKWWFLGLGVSVWDACFLSFMYNWNQMQSAYFNAFQLRR